MSSDILQAIEEQLTRVAPSREVAVALDEEFDRQMGTLVAVEYGGANWHLLPATFLSLLKELPDGAGAESVKEAIEAKADPVWHGPAPKTARGTSR